MNLLNSITHCPGTLKENYDSYSPLTLRNVFSGKKVSHVLPYKAPKMDEETRELFMSNRERLSISGVQMKVSLIQEKNKLRLTRSNEQGTHILKPIPSDLKKVEDLPANEHVTMQIANQAFNIKTAENSLIFFKDGEPAYLTKRFDVRKEDFKWRKEDFKWRKEDFASLAGSTKDNKGDNFKYDADYVQLGKLIQEFIPAWRVEIEKYFSLVLFNYIFSNGDAHLKNFAVLENENGDYLLSPAYDLVFTKLHVSDVDFALTGGLMDEKIRSKSYLKTGKPTKQDFIRFAEEIGIKKNRIDKLLAPYINKNEQVKTLIDNSFLSESSKKTYLFAYQTKVNSLTRK